MWNGRSDAEAGLYVLRSITYFSAPQLLIFNSTSLTNRLYTLTEDYSVALLDAISLKLRKNSGSRKHIFARAFFFWFEQQLDIRALFARHSSYVRAFRIDFPAGFQQL